MAEIIVHHGDSRDVLKGLANSSIDSCVTDPPYALVSIVKRFGGKNAAPAHGDVYARASAGFMGQQWDTGETAFSVAFWREVLRVMKPGAHLIAFSGTRTYHRLACAIEDAGFEIRDMVSWLYGSGFPKSHNQPGGWGTALKPACEPVVLARKPLDGTVAANLSAHGTGALNIDACRIEGQSTLRIKAGGKNDFPHEDDAWEPRSVQVGSDLGRWPANVIHDGSPEVVEAFPQTESGGGERNSGARQSDGWGMAGGDAPRAFEANAGSAARFFYSAKADSEDRLGSKHPTVKPVDLMAYLCRLVTPPGGTVLDPFAGSGSTGIACLREGFACVLIEREAEYVADINRRVAWAKGEGRLTALEMARAIDPDKAAGLDTPLFGGEAA